MILENADDRKLIENFIIISRATIKLLNESGALTNPHQEGVRMAEHWVTYAEGILNAE